MEAIKKLIRSLNLQNKNGYTVAVLIALIFVSFTVAGYYLFLRPPQKGYMTIYLYDSQKTALNYPELLIINKNNTFNVWVEVENHMGDDEYCEVRLKVTNDTIPMFPVNSHPKNTYEKTLKNEEHWETLSTITMNESGIYSVVFELWVYDEKAGLKFSGDTCVLNVEVVNQTLGY